MKNAIYVHCYCINNWSTILQEIVDAIVFSGLYTASEKVVINMCQSFNQSELDSIIYYYKKIEARFTGGNNYEWDTLSMLYNECDNYDTVLYTHTKGVSQHLDRRQQSWRKLLLYEVVSKWQNHIEALTEYDTSGICIRERMYQGNFWWAKSEYIKNTAKSSGLQGSITSARSE